jgi:hypothetical protein
VRLTAHGGVVKLITEPNDVATELEAIEQK